MENEKSKNRITDMPSKEFKKYGNEIIEWVDEYLSGIEKFRVLPEVKPGEIKKELPDSMPDKGESFDKIFTDFQEKILPGITHWQHPNFMAYFNSTSTAPGIFGERRIECKWNALEIFPRNKRTRKSNYKLVQRSGWFV